MTQPSLDLGPSSFTECVALLFKAAPMQWIDAKQLMVVGGMFGWRTRISNCRTELGMTIENKVERHTENGRTWQSSCYRYVPSPAVVSGSGGE